MKIKNGLNTVVNLNIGCTSTLDYGANLRGIFIVRCPIRNNKIPLVFHLWGTVVKPFRVPLRCSIVWSNINKFTNTMERLDMIVFLLRSHYVTSRRNQFKTSLTKEKYP